MPHLSPPARPRPRRTARAGARLAAACLAATCLAAAALPRHAASAALPSRAADLGAVAPGTTVSATVYLAPRDPAGLAALVAALQTPGDPNFHRFLTRSAFTARFAPTADTVAAVAAALRGMGVAVGALSANGLSLRVSAPAAAMGAAFGVSLHTLSRGGRTGTWSLAAPAAPASIARFVRAIGVHETLMPQRSGALHAFAATAAGAATAAPPHPGASASASPAGSYLPADYANAYDLAPLTAAGATGAGTTIGIVTEANFSAADPAAFWSRIGLSTGAARLAVIDVDGGTDPATPGYGTDPTESDLDVEQAGGVAPSANVRAYVTPNASATDLLDGFQQAASDDLADVVSCSWGRSEIDYFPTAITGGRDDRPMLVAFHDVLEEMAAQGQTVFTDADDNGAYLLNRADFPVWPVVGGAAAYSSVYSIHHPSADPLVTAAGGTSLPFAATYAGVSIDVPAEQAWSWSYYLIGSRAQHQSNARAATLLEETYAVGGGGGASIYWPAPSWQQNLAGVVASMPDQSLVQLAAPRTTLATEPAGFAGRNIPDLSANANPDIGYLVIVGGQPVTFEGGTSFVAPQFAGTLALMVQLLGHRVGQLDPMLYALQAKGAAPARDIAAGDIWGYTAGPGYDQATGLGAMDAARLYAGLRSLD